MKLQIISILLANACLLAVCKGYDKLGVIIALLTALVIIIGLYREFSKLRKMEKEIEL